MIKNITKKFHYKMYRLLLLALTGSIVGLYSFQYWNNEKFKRDEILPKDITVEQAFATLGNRSYNHKVDKLDQAKADIGRDLIFIGKTDKHSGSSLISPYFVCTDCHNMGQEFSSPMISDPDDRLAFAKKNGLPFLPASTFWGIYDRNSFYNDDYVKKYGSLVDNARDSLGNAIQLCAKYCSAGRHLEEWEEEAILHYFKSKQLTLDDVVLTDNEKKNILKYQYLSDEEKKTLIQTLDHSFVRGYSATFKDPMPRDERKYGEGGNVENGKFIYEKSCMYCHYDNRVTYLNLDTDVLSGKMFWKNRKGYDNKTIYQIVRYGTYTMPGRKQYMPHFTNEKMSDQQIEDLMAFIKQLAKK